MSTPKEDPASKDDIDSLPNLSRLELEPSAALSPPADFQTPSSREPNASSKTTFLTLPLEIRLQIYELLLIGQHDRHKEGPNPYIQGPEQRVNDTNQNMIVDPGYKDEVPLARHKMKPTRTMDTEILQTCQQIYHEANRILYSGNVFWFDNVPRGFLQQIGTANIKLLRKMRIRLVDWKDRLNRKDMSGEWTEFVEILAEKATGLRSLEVEFAVLPQCRKNGHFIIKKHQRGLGDNLEFVRALGGLRNLEELCIMGIYCKQWPEYLERSLGIVIDSMVGSVCVHWSSLFSNERPLDMYDFKLFKVLDPLLFDDYQVGIDNLVP